MRPVLEAFERGQLTLPQVLEKAETAPRPARDRGSIIIATLPGDVHAIGRAILVSLFSASGYTVHDLGSQVPVETIVEAAIRLKPDAIGLSALLVTTSRQMSVCVQELDRRGVHIPVLIGGAAINRSFGRRSAILPDGRIYRAGVFYCRDVFEGLATMEALIDPSRRKALIDRALADIEAERGIADLPASGAPPPGTPSGPVDADVPTPPHLGARMIVADLPEVWQRLDRNTLFRYHWGGHRLRGDDYEDRVRHVFEPLLGELTDDALKNGWLQAEIVLGFFACNSWGDDLLVYDAAGPGERTRFNFPRQPSGERLCLADYFRPVAAGERDVVALQAVTTGPGAGRLVESLLRSGQYARMAYVSGLAAATAEALADYAHAIARRDMGLPPDRGLRFSWGYAACPDLHEQRKVVDLLEADQRIGLRLTESDNLDPEHSTIAIVVHHPEAKYFSVRQ